MLLRFQDGPAADQEIHTSVSPGHRRWFCEMTERDTSWWVLDEEPPSDSSLTVTPYILCSSVTDEDHGIVHTFARSRR